MNARSKRLDEASPCKYRDLFKRRTKKPLRFCLFFYVCLHMFFQPVGSRAYADQLKVGLLVTAIQFPAFCEFRHGRLSNIVKNIDAQFLNLWNGCLISRKKTHRVNIVEPSNNLPYGRPKFSSPIGGISMNSQPVISVTEKVTANKAQDSGEKIENYLLHIFVFIVFSVIGWLVKAELLVRPEKNKRC